MSARATPGLIAVPPPLASEIVESARALDYDHLLAAARDPMRNSALEAVIRELSRELKLAAFQREYPALCRRAREGRWPALRGFFARTARSRGRSQHNSTARRLLREARFPDIKTLDQVDWTALKGHIETENP